MEKKGPKPRPLSERFFHRTKRTESGCLEWQGSVGSSGYGQLGAEKPAKGMVSAHRTAWILANGSIPPGKFVCHKCDNKRCVEITHLFLGSPKDNTLDMVAKGRGRDPSPMYGTENPACKLTPEQVLEIRALMLTEREIARRFNISRSQVNSIRSRRSWKFL